MTVDKNKLEFFVFRIFAFVVQLFGGKSVGFLSTCLAYLLYYIIPIRKDVVIENLQSAFPKKEIDEIKSLAYRNYKSFGIMFFEFMLMRKLNEDQIKNMVELPPFELINEKLAKNKGVIILTAHFGNWEIGGCAFALYFGKSLNVLAKPQRNNFVTDWFNSTREIFGNKVISLGTSVREIFAALKNNEMVALVGDQRGPSDGLRVKLFNRDTSIYTGTAEIALKTKCELLFMLAARQPDGKYKLVWEEISYDETLTRDEKVFQINQQYMSILEKYIREYPEQWFWMHNIWKY